ncbi:PRC-barrel domain-containing protein [Nitrosomonas communis]|uniref:Sporulation protein YlmC, PRC-barrel domain family n=1 Tax=Nitrosomonas communis TaxID=44574 RepID=A0A1H2TIE4_9PROT|nr:PRC-barrel domain-containing protein [Nitrosomonas communis]SDW43537.1 Sporulation protein YlmC, PRC-barrel domain family [Nitrosomonas communis]
MTHNKFLLSIASIISLSFLFTCASAQTNEKQEWEKDNNSKSKAEQSYGSGDDVEWGSTDVAYAMTATNLMDMKVIDQTGKKIGEIDDLILSTKEKVAYAIISVGGFLGVGDKLVSIPFQDIEIRKAKKEAVINLSKQELEKMPEFKSESVESRNYQAEDVPAMDATERLTRGGTEDYAINAKKLFDVDIIDKNSKKVGEVDDLLLSQDGKVVYGIVDVGGMLGMGKKSVAVPFHHLTANRTEERILLNVTKEQLEKAPEFKFRNKD